MLNTMLAHAGTTAGPIAELTVQMYNGEQLAPRLRELAILAVAHSIGCEYEWVQHEAMSTAVGISKPEQDAIRCDNLGIDTFTDAERAVIRFAGACATAPIVSDEIFTAAYEYLTERQIVTLIELVGLYWTFGRVITVLEIPTELPTGESTLAGIANLNSELQTAVLPTSAPESP